MYLDVNGQRLNVVAFGSGSRTFVATGGWAGSWELWQQPFEVLSQTMRTIAYDHRGTGESAVLESAITFDGLVHDVFGVLDILGISQCVLAAESSGARVALAAALQQPARFAGLVLVDGSHLRGRAPGTNPFADALRADFEGTIRGFMDRCTPDPDHGHIRRWGCDILRRSGTVAAARLAELGTDDDFIDELPEMQVPTLIIHSSGDRIVPLATAEALHALLPDSELAVIESSSHVPTMTDVTTVVTLIEHFLSRRLPPE